MTFRPLAAALPFALAACAWSGPGVPMKLDAAGTAPALAPGEVVQAAKLVLVNNGATAGEAKSKLLSMSREAGTARSRRAQSAMSGRLILRLALKEPKVIGPGSRAGAGASAGGR